MKLGMDKTIAILLTISVVAAGVAAWAWWLWPDDDGESDNVTEMRRVYQLHAEDRKYVPFVSDDVIEAHRELTRMLEENEDAMLRRHPDDDALAILVGERRAERTAVAMSALGDLMANAEVVIATPTPEPADDAPALILAEGVVFECALLRAWFGDDRSYARLSEEMTYYFDEADRHSDFDVDAASAALSQCGVR